MRKGLPRKNYGQGSSREQAAAAPGYGLRMVVTESFARIHRQNLINYEALPSFLFVRQIMTVSPSVTRYGWKTCGRPSRAATGLY
ncbi:MAG: hypothetical protein ACR652_23470 [Methylocystis sp.]|uniref:hypothetical protein n=1 Tax=Methylocystis sp. TaxID=1911079 RepID=UPI003DA24A35